MSRGRLDLLRPLTAGCLAAVLPLARVLVRRRVALDVSASEMRSRTCRGSA